MSVDPLANYNPVFETEHYGDGQHNGGIFNDKNLNTYGYCYGNPVVLVDPNGKQSQFQKVFEENMSQMSNAIKDVGRKINDRLSAARSEVSKIVNATNNSLNTIINNAKKALIEISKKPIISRTQTVKESVRVERIPTLLGDRLTTETSNSTSKGNANGLLNLDITTDLKGSFDSATLTTALGQSVGTNGTSISLGQSYGNSEAHIGIGPGIGLGEYNFGTSSTNKGITGGSDLTARPGLGTAIIAVGVATAPEWGPVVAPLAGATTAVIPFINNNQ